MAAWLQFYRNSIGALEHDRTAFAPIHARAAGLAVGERLIDLGSCFGFFPLRMQRLGFDVLATDLSVPTMDLLRRVSRPPAPHSAHPGLRRRACPLPDGAADTVTALHLLEHLDRVTGEQVLAEALRLARRRVVVAVPFEDEPQACYGHIRRFDTAELARLGAQFPPGVRATVTEFHGGWLVLDRSNTPES